MHYTIATEDKNREGIRSILSHYFDGFTLIPSEGSWKGRKELALTISIAGSVDPHNVQQAAEEIKALNNQEAVMVMATPCELAFV